MSQVQQAVAAAPDHPDLPYKPPLAFVLAMALGFLLERLAPIAAPPAATMPLGIALVGAGVALLAWAAATMRAHRTAIEPWKPTTVIVDSGPFGRSRNPIYVAFGVIQAGIGSWTARPWVILLVLPAWLATAWWIVPREEAYLTRKFGETYTAYRRRVRRWV